MNNIGQIKDLTSEKLTTDECLAPGLASIVMKVEKPDLSNFRGEFKGDSLTVDTGIEWCGKTSFQLTPLSFFPCLLDCSEGILVGQVELG